MKIPGEDLSVLSDQPSVEDLDVLCEQWAVWSRTRRLYGPHTSLKGALGALTPQAHRPLHSFHSREVDSARLSALHIAYLCQPEALDKQVFYVYYVLRIKPVKRAAAALGISREHFHRLLNAFRGRVIRAAEHIRSDKLDR